MQNKDIKKTNNQSITGDTYIKTINYILVLT